MRISKHLGLMGALVSLAAISCSGDDGGSGSASEGSTAGSTSAGTEASTTAGSGSASATTGGPAGSGSESMGESTTSEGGSESDASASMGSTSEATTGPVSATDTTSGASDATSEAGSDSEATTGVGSDTDTDTDTGSGSDSGEDPPPPPPPCEPGEGGGEVFDYLWIANTNQGSVSKINASTFVEVARYYTDPVQSGASSPSRTSVSLDGRYVVVSNRDTASVTKIAANEEDCVDKNNDGVIQTSKDKAQLLPYNQEECILWTTKVTVNNHQWGPRATAFGIPKWNVDTCKYEEEKVWIGYMISATAAQVARLNSYTGAIEAKVDIPNFPLYASYSPYGAAVDPDGDVWITGVFSRAAIRIDAETLEVKRWDSPYADSHYGMTVDQDGRVWFANWQGHGGISVFDPVSEQWAVIPGSGGHIYRGIASDGKGGIWAASNAGGAFGCGVLQVDGNDLVVKQHHKFAQCGTPLGVGFDGQGKLWYVDYSGWTWQMDPGTQEKKQLVVPNLHYTYSDFTGSGLGGVVPQ